MSIFTTHEKPQKHTIMKLPWMTYKKGRPHSFSSCLSSHTSLTSILLFALSFSFFFFFTIAHWDEGSRPAARAHARQACLGSVVCVGTHLCVSVMCEHVRVELRGGEWSMLPRGRGGETGGDCLTWSVSSRIPFPQSQSIHSASPISSLSRPRRSYHDSLSQLCILKVIRLTCERTLNAQRKKKWICYRCNYIHSSVAVLKAAPLRLPSLPIVHAFFSLHLF